MTANGVTKLLAKVVPHHGLKSVGPVDLSLEHVQDAEELERKISDWGGTGWIARQSGVCVISDGVGDNPSLGLPISAEIVISTTCTHQIRCVQGGWNITTVAENNGETHLAETIKHIAQEGRIAIYRRYWSLPEDGAAEVVAWRLTGFEEMS